MVSESFKKILSIEFISNSEPSFTTTYLTVLSFKIYLCLSFGIEGSIGKYAAPAFSTPSIAIIHDIFFSINIATNSFGFTPLLTKCTANLLDATSKS